MLIKPELATILHPWKLLNNFNLEINLRNFNNKYLKYNEKKIIKNVHN